MPESSDIPPLTPETLTVWPDPMGLMDDEVTPYGELMQQDRHVVEWDAQRQQFIGLYPV